MQQRQSSSNANDSGSQRRRRRCHRQHAAAAVVPPVCINTAPAALLTSTWLMAGPADLGLRKCRCWGVRFVRHVDVAQLRADVGQEQQLARVLSLSWTIGFPALFPRRFVLASCIVVSLRRRDECLLLQLEHFVVVEVVRVRLASRSVLFVGSSFPLLVIRSIFAPVR